MVRGHGPLDAHIAIIGEHPGPDEEKAGIPFIGGSGRLLNELLGKVGIRRTILSKLEGGRPHLEVESEVYITNISKEIPKGKFETEFYDDPKKRIPNQKLLHLTQCLKEELSLCGARVLVAAGDHALQVLTSKRGISSWRGSILESTLLPGRKVIPMVHPAKILREWSFRVLTIQDLKRIKEQSEFPEIRRPPRTFIIRPTFEQTMAACRRLAAGSPSEGEEFAIAFDIETKGTHIACIGFADSEEWAICIPFISAGKHYWPSPSVEMEVWREVAQVLSSPHRKIAQNCLFDMSHLAAHGVQVKNMWFDTMLAQSVLYPELEKSLAILCSLYTEHPYYKGEGRAALRAKSEKAWSAAQIDEVLWNYNCTDCIVTYKVAKEQQKDFRDLSHGLRAA